MNVYGHSRVALQRALVSICNSIDENIDARKNRKLSESELRMEMVACLLGSQVRAESSNSAVARLKRAGLLSSRRWSSVDDEFEVDIREVLQGKRMRRQAISYRFPAIRARQLALMRSRLASSPLASYIEDGRDIFSVRKALVEDIPGIGPKQASMFLRNVGRSLDLAILDVHVLRFLKLMNVLPEVSPNVSSLSSYERVEKRVTEFAGSIGRPVGHLDWAIWITMRAASEVSS